MGKSHSRQQNQHEPLLQKENRDKRSPPPKVINVALIGGGDVGKSALVVQFVSNQFLVDYDPTIEEHYRKVIRFGGEEFLLDLLDTAGQEKFAVMRDCYLKYNQSFIFVYSVTSKSSFEEIRTIYQQVQRVRDEEVPVGILIGNKIDLKSEREVSTEEGQKLGIELNLPFLETSALNRTNVEGMFQLIGSHTLSGERTNCAKISKKIKPARQISLKTLSSVKREKGNRFHHCEISRPFVKNEK